MKKWLVVAVISLVAGAAFAQEQPPGAADFLAGQEAMKKNDFASAIPALEKALAANPDLYAGHYYLGFAYQSNKEWDKSGDNFKKFLSRVGDDPKAAQMVGLATRHGGLALARGKNPSSGIPLLKKAVTSKPSDTEAQFYLGVTLMRDRQDTQAERAFAKVIELDPSLHRAQYYAGRINFNNEQWELADQRLGKFIELKADDALAPDAHFMLGSIAVRAADSEEDATAKHDTAIQHLESFIAAKPTAPQSPQAHYILGSIAAQREDNETAKGHFEKYLELEPDGAQAEEVKQFLQDLAND